MAGARGKAPEVVKENRERWLLTYADLITLLLAFFVIMYAISNTDIVKYLNLRGSLADAFNVGVRTGEVTDSIRESGQVSQPGAIPGITSPEVTSVETQLESLQQGKGEFEEIVQFVGQRPEGIAIGLADALLFVSGSAELRSEGAERLALLAEALRPMPNDLRIEGHTDNISPGSERFPTNWELSTARAVAVARFLEGTGIAPFRLSAFGFAEHRPLASNNDPATRGQNRRVEIVILNPAMDVLGGRP